MRVRALSMELGKREGGDVKLLEVAGTCTTSPNDTTVLS